VTLADVDRVHEKGKGAARRAFNRHKNYFVENEDYFVTSSHEAKKNFGIMAPNGLIALTESGYLMIAKVFDDDLAWEVQRSLVNSYFRLKDVVAAVTAPSEERTVLDEITSLKIGIKNLYRVIRKQSDKLDHITSLLEKSDAVRKDAGLEPWRNRVMVEPELLLNVLRIILCQIAEEC
jgi:hypothetical protein